MSQSLKSFEIEMRSKGFVETSPGVWGKPLFGEKLPEPSSKAVEHEGDLRDSILAWCDSQWPKWKVEWARSDKKSTLPLGCHDLTVFASGGRVFCFELKSKDGKIDPDQRDWIYEMSMIEHHVHVIRSFDEFLNKVNV